MNKRKAHLTVGLLIFVGTYAYSQKLMEGMVVDANTLTNLIGVNVKIKNTDRGTSTNANGVFTLLVSEKDTLVFTAIGYAPHQQAVYFEDEIMFVQMHEESVMLKEVIVKDREFRINQKYPQSPTLTTTKRLRAGNGASGANGGGTAINLARFSKEEKEKRRLIKVMAEDKKIKAYLQVVNDPDVKAEIMERHDLTEERFYELLALYNEKNRSMMYAANAALILNSLMSYYEESARK